MKKRGITRNAFFITLFLQISILSSFSAPLIKVDKDDVNVGIIREGIQQSIKHTFILKNIGDEVLIIEKIKSTCGCTNIGYDSVIPPGREGKVTFEINLKGMHKGPVKKYVTVLSNAKNKPQLRLYLGCTYITELEIEPKVVSFRCDKYGFTTQTFNISSTKGDLKVLEVSFRQNPENEEEALSWQVIHPILFNFSLTKIDSSKIEGIFKYKLEVNQKIDHKNPLSGFLSIKTNYPQKEEIKIYAVILEKGSAPTQ